MFSGTPPPHDDINVDQSYTGPRDQRGSLSRSPRLYNTYSVHRKIRKQQIVYGIYYNTIILSSAQQLYVYIQRTWFLRCGVSTYLPTYLTIPTQYPSTDDDGGAASVMCRDAHMSLHCESTQLVFDLSFLNARKKDDAVRFSAPFVAAVGQALGLYHQEITYYRS